MEMVSCCYIHGIKLKFQLANSCHLLEYTLFPTILQHLIYIYAIILVSIVCTARLLSNAWERKGCKPPSDNTVSHFSLNQGLLKCMPRLCIDPEPGLQTKITAKSISSVRGVHPADIACSAGQLDAMCASIIQEFQSTSAQEVQWQLVISVNLVSMRLCRPISLLNEGIVKQERLSKFMQVLKPLKQEHGLIKLSKGFPVMVLQLKCKKKHVVHGEVVEPGCYYLQLGVVLIMAGQEIYPILHGNISYSLLFSALSTRKEGDNVFAAAMSHMPSWITQNSTQPK
jgi:hypothetical protein